MSAVFTFVIVPLSVMLAVLFVVLSLAEPSVAYRIVAPVLSVRDPQLLPRLATVCGSVVRPFVGAEVYSRGELFYEAELRAIARATVSVHLEAYIFHEGRAAERFVQALTERARAGVTVRLVLDGFGNLFTRRRFFAELIAAGGHVEWYQPLRWYTLKRYNNRTHRELLVIDGRVAFVGGAGIADWWLGEGTKPPWRDTVVRFSGPLVSPLQAVFAENWLAASGEILFGAHDFAATSEDCDEGDGPPGFLVASAPSEARATRVRVLYQTLVASARSEIKIQTPYFVPDRSLRRELLRAAERGVSIDVVVPGPWNNHKATRLASRALYGSLLRAGIAIREYAPSMNHTKTLVIDGHVSVFGSSNWDNRSGSLNDELNLVIEDDALARRLREDFAEDAASSRVITLEEWRRRGVLEKVFGMLAVLLVRQE